MRYKDSSRAFVCLVMLVLFSTLATTAYGSGSDEDEIESSDDLTMEEKKAAIWMTAQELVDRYDANEARANHELKGKRLVVSGEVDNIDEHEVFGGYTVLLKTNNMFSSVHCKTENVDFALSLDKGTSITVTGIGDGQVMGSPFIEDCVPYWG